MSLWAVKRRKLCMAAQRSLFILIKQPCKNAVAYLSVVFLFLLDCLYSEGVKLNLL